jgi:subtilase family serine protease
MLKVQWQILPCIDEFYTQTPYGYLHSQGGQRIQKADKEQWVLLPENGTNLIRAGIYYLAAVSEGQNPSGDDRIGTGPCSWTFESLGMMGVSNLGTVGQTDLVQADTVEGGAAKAYQFTVPPGTVSFEVRLEDRVGNPNMKLVLGDQLPSIYYYYHSGGDDHYGNYGGVYPPLYGFNVITLPNPSSGVYSLIVNASETTYNSADFTDASYTLRVRYPIPVSLNFSSNLNTNGQTNVVSGTLADNQREFFKVIVPATNNGQAVLGWRLELAQSQGAATVRVRKDLLPADSAAGTMPFVSLSALLVPPFLTPGTWYVEVRGTGATTYTLTSQMYEPERPVWNMPLSGESVTTPGLTSPEFGDTGTDTNGVPLPGDRGIDLENGRLHYYAVNVPTNNAVLIRTMLEAISGNPDLYIRAGFPPTLSHNASGSSGSIYERANTGTATEYRNWVPHDGRYESWLTSGVWHFAVRAASDANCRYRLHITSGTVTDLALDGGSLINQAVAGGDWRYYRLEVPTNAPAHWNVTFSQQQGDVVMYVRDTSPPGDNVSADGYYPYTDWAHDNKNNGTYLNYDAAGTYDLPTPPLRPGQTYYLGFRAVNDAMFSVSSAVSGVAGNPVLVPFLNGFTSISIPAYGSMLYAFQVPEDATSWIHSSVHAASVQLYLEQGTIPRMDTTADWRSAGAANSRFNQTLGAPYGWPWMPNQTYYLLATNTSSSAQTFSITMSGPDLLPVALAWTHESVAGKPLTLVGTVTNRGNDTALASWYDRVYLSSNAVWDAQDVSLGSVNCNQSISAGGHYTWTNTVTLSQWQPGNYYLLVRPDDWNGNSWVFESDEMNNTMAFPVTLTAPDLQPLNLGWTAEAVAGKPLTLISVVTNQGNGTAVSSWSDYVYLSSNAVWDAQDTYLNQGSRSQPVNAGGSYTWTNTLTLSQWQPGSYYLIVKTDNNSFLFESNEGNNTLAFPVTLTAPDLVPTNLTWTGEAVAGKPLTLVGVVTNQGNGMAVSSWSDYVYMSSNAVWDAQDVSLGYVNRNQSVASGGSYTWTNSVTLSQWQPGVYYLILKTDRDANVFESSETNNTQAFPVTLSAPDLVPTNLTWTAEAVAGKPLTLVGVVTNQGNSTAQAGWYDYVYLSSNEVWDAQDVSLGNVYRNLSVASGASYTWTNTMTLSQWQPGTYYLILKTDRDASLFESNEGNNSVAYPVNIVAPDLAPVNLLCLTEAIAGRAVMLVGTVTNQGNGTAVSSWSDYVYLSSNAVWDAQDVYQGSVSRNQSVAVGASYTWTNTVTLSQWQPGTYYLLVKTDNNSAVFESNETNNSVAYLVNMMAITPPPNDLFVNRKVLSGLSIVTTGRNVDATPETGEPTYVNKGRSVWWTWTAPFSGIVTNSTSGSNFDTVMGVYTGSTVTALSPIAQDDDSGDGSASQVTFNAVAGTSYQIAVDGYNGASGTIFLNLFASGAPQFNADLQMTNGGVRVSFNAGWGVTNEVQACTNLVNAQWRTVTNLYSTAGFLEFIDLDATNYPCRFYRIKVQ